MSFLPDDALVLHGGCNCSAIRYTLTLPASAQRPIWTPAAQSNGQGDIRAPLIVICHCDDCRRAWASPLTFGIMCPRAFVTLSSLRKDVAPPPVRARGAPRPDEQAAERASHDQRVQLTAEEAARPGPATEDTLLAFYHSTTTVWRSFCARCGTPVAYVNLAESEDGETFLPTMDFPLATLDRQDVVTEWVRPDRHVGWRHGVGWVKEMFSKDGLPKHSTTDFGQFSFGLFDGES